MPGFSIQQFDENLAVSSGVRHDFFIFVSGSFHVLCECKPRFGGKRCEARETPARFFAEVSPEIFVNLPR